MKCNYYTFPPPQESPTKDVIVWDIKRTYVAHEFFREPSGREALEKISKAYSVYDEEVGYCQGLSFIVAVLLLQVGLPHSIFRISMCIASYLFCAYDLMLLPLVPPPTHTLQKLTAPYELNMHLDWCEPYLLKDIFHVVGVWVRGLST